MVSRSGRRRINAILARRDKIVALQLKASDAFVKMQKMAIDEGESDSDSEPSRMEVDSQSEEEVGIVDTRPIGPSVIAPPSVQYNPHAQRFDRSLSQNRYHPYHGAQSGQTSHPNGPFVLESMPPTAPVALRQSQGKSPLKNFHVPPHVAPAVLIAKPSFPEPAVNAGIAEGLVRPNFRAAILSYPPTFGVPSFNPVLGPKSVLPTTLDLFPHRQTPTKTATIATSVTSKGTEVPAHSSTAAPLEISIAKPLNLAIRSKILSRLKEKARHLTYLSGPGAEHGVDDAIALAAALFDPVVASSNIKNRAAGLRFIESLSNEYGLDAVMTPGFLQTLQRGQLTKHLPNAASSGNTTAISVEGLLNLGLDLHTALGDCKDWLGAVKATPKKYRGQKSREVRNGELPSSGRSLKELHEFGQQSGLGDKEYTYDPEEEAHIIKGLVVYDAALDRGSYLSAVCSDLGHGVLLAWPRSLATAHVGTEAYRAASLIAIEVLGRENRQMKKAFAALNSLFDGGDIRLGAPPLRLERYKNPVRSARELLLGLREG